MARQDTGYRLAEILKKDISYNSELKKAFKSAAKAYLNQLLPHLELKEAKISYNEGGIAVSGEASLYGMWDEDHGVCVYIQQSMGKASFMYREIKHMKDYTGGRNNWINQIVDPKIAAEMILTLRKQGEQS